MEEKIVDARGKPCPMPLIMTKQALKSLQTGHGIRVLLDNETSKNNVERFLADNDVPFECISEKGVFTLRARKTAQSLAHPDAESYCAITETGSKDHCILIASDKMGNGPDELGSILMKAFVNTLKEVKPLPSHIVFYNSGILCATEGSTLIESLVELQGLGVEILVCGTCVNYFGKHNAVKVGVVSNMYTIIETLTAARSVIKP